MPGVSDHKMAIEVHIWQMLPQTSHNWRSNGKIGYEMPVSPIKYPSMMSMCSEVAPTSTISWHSLKRKAKSAESIEGPITHLLSCILFIITDLRSLLRSHLQYQLNMGSNVNSKLMGTTVSPLNWKDLPAEARETFIVREILTHSEDQHRQLLITLSRFKQYECRNVVKLVDSHTVQSNNLCSIMNYIYAVLEKPKLTLSSYMSTRVVSSEQICRIISDVAKGISFLKKEDNDVDRIKEEMIFIQEEENGDVTAKIMNPFFKDCGYEGEQAKGPIVEMGSIFKKYLNASLHNQETAALIARMSSSSISLQELQSRFPCDGKKSKQGLKLVKKPPRNNLQRYSKTTRIQRESITSNGSSLMIDADGDRSELLFKDFYQNGEESTSIWQLQSQQNATHCQQEFSHQFPKRYMKIRTCSKSQRTQSSSASERPLQSDFSSLLSSAKLAQSFIGP